jgi:benzaldehyde dehydrogenase (NAD)
VPIGEQNLFIDGHWVPSESGKTYKSINPFTGGVATLASAATAVDV